MSDNAFKPVHVILVQVSVTPFQHLVVGHDLLEHSVNVLALEFHNGILSIRGCLPSGFDIDDFGTLLLPIIVRIGDE